ncbi:hypothetical protein L484_004208 [Morus notabilis]|uniref:Uncharacterized protein n=1 Tax=Morus notabilis TaxID=981085 RepID=W9RU08_9ROSA|nr:hypothetical protein L484_004208 [Morus notabilis]
MISSGKLSSSGVEDKLGSNDKSSGSMEEDNIEYRVGFCGENLWDSTNACYLSPEFGFLQDDYSAEEFLFSKYQLHEEKYSEFGLLNDARFNVASPPLDKCLEEIAKLGEDEIPSVISGIGESKKENKFPFPLASLELLRNYSGGLRRLKRERRVMEPSNDSTCGEVGDKRLSCVEIMKIAGARFIQSSSLEANNHPFERSLCGLSNEDTKDVELVELLLACAEKVGCQQFERAGKLLNQCDQLCSTTGNPVQRVVYYFCEALRGRIDKETGRSKTKGLGKEQLFDPDVAMMRLNATHHAFHETIPFSQLSIFAGIQAIVESVEGAKKIHIIDFAIRSGLQWTVLMQALASCHESPLELLKITALGTTQKHVIEETGERLLSFAQTLNIPLSFKIVMVSDMTHLKQELFELDFDEKVICYSYFLFRSMLALPDQLESAMRVMRSLNPCVMVVTEVEANMNSPSFANRFIEALFFYGAYFDCLETFMKRDCRNRMAAESLYFGEGIRNTVAAEGKERKIRNVSIDVWRAFFTRYGLEDVELSPSSLYQVELILKKFSCEDSCTLDVNGNCLIFLWKGTPIQSLSVWKSFQY